MSKLLNLDPVIKGAGKAFGGGKEGAISAVFDPGNLRDKITGKSEKEAGKAKAQSATDAARIIEEQTTKAREDIFKLFPIAQQNLRGGFQGALDVFGQSLPAQTGAFQQGNVGAQQQLLAGLPQIQNALLGGQIDFSQLQPTQIQTPDLGFFQQQLPEFVDPFAGPTNEDMGQGGLPPNDPFVGPLPGNTDPLAGTAPPQTPAIPGGGTLVSPFFGGGFSGGNPFGGGFFRP